ncbi:MAG: 3'-5' exonuclease [Oscillospiraceae bacterium]
MLDTLFAQFENLIILDLETSGLDFKSDEIIELGAVRAVSIGGELSIDKEVSSLIKLSERKVLSPKITEITGITQNTLDKDGVEKDFACGLLVDLLSCERPLIVAYNAQFDLCFMYYFLNRFGKAGILKNARLLDALTVYKDRRDYPHKLENAIEAYGVSVKNTHRAIDDVKATLALLCAMEEEAGDLNRYINLFGYNPKYGISGPKISSVNYLPQAYSQKKKLYE